MEVNKSEEEELTGDVFLTEVFPVPVGPITLHISKISDDYHSKDHIFTYAIERGPGSS